MDCDAVMSALGNLTLARRADGRFVRVGSLPTWCAALEAPALRTASPVALEEVFPFLGTFLEEAERAWRTTAPATSGVWVESSPAGEAIHLEATAVRVAGDAIVVVCRSEERFAAQQRVLQRARELRLAHEELALELEHKDILLHTLVHDLATPLRRLLGSVALLLEQDLGRPAAECARAMHEDLMRQQQIVTTVLEAFSVELDRGPRTRDGPIELRGVIDDVVAVQRPIAARRGVQLEVVSGPGALVAVDARRAQRVIDQLVGNAVQDSPSGTQVAIATRADDGWCRLSIEDARPPLPLEAVPRLFERFGTVGAGPAAAVGLYFCRISAERWGGGIGYEQSEAGGRRFWVRLPLARR